MTELDDELLPEVQALIAELGKVLSYTDVSRTRDPVSGETTVVEVLHSVLGAPPSRYSQRWVDGDAVKAGDARTSLAGQGLIFTPEIGDKVTFDATTWRVVRVDPVYSGESTVLWKLQLRR